MSIVYLQMREAARSKKATEGYGIIYEIERCQAFSYERVFPQAEEKSHRCNSQRKRSLLAFLFPISYYLCEPLRTSAVNHFLGLRAKPALR